MGSGLLLLEELESVAIVLEMADDNAIEVHRVLFCRRGGEEPAVLVVTTSIPLK